MSVENENNVQILFPLWKLHVLFKPMNSIDLFNEFYQLMLIDSFNEFSTKQMRILKSNSCCYLLEFFELGFWLILLKKWCHLTIYSFIQNWILRIFCFDRLKYCHLNLLKENTFHFLFLMFYYLIAYLPTDNSCMITFEKVIMNVFFKRKLDKMMSCVISHKMCYFRNSRSSL